MNKKQEALRVWRQAEELDPDNRYIVPVMQRLGVDKKLN
jgi:hypothetical protein